MITTQEPPEYHKPNDKENALVNAIYIVLTTSCEHHNLSPCQVMGALEIARSIFFQENIGFSDKKP